MKPLVVYEIMAELAGVELGAGVGEVVGEVEGWVEVVLVVVDEEVFLFFITKIPITTKTAMMATTMITVRLFM